MICPKCRHDKLLDPCPTCGLFEPEALLEAAEEQGSRGNLSQQLVLWNKYLKLLPDDLKVAQHKVLLKFILFNNNPKSDQLDALKLEFGDVLMRDWSWTPGHELRVQLYQNARDLKTLEGIYKKHCQSKDAAEKLIDENIIKIIHLTEKFSENPPQVQYLGDESANGGLLKSRRKWILMVLIPAGIWQVWISPSNPTVEEDEKYLWTLCVEFVLAFLTVTIYWLVKKMNKNKGKK